MIIAGIEHGLQSGNLPQLLVIGVITVVAFYLGKGIRFIRLPSIIGFMLTGVILGPSVFGILSSDLHADVGFITETALGFVALSIGLELSLSSLKQQGKGIIIVILAESLLAFFAVTAGLYVLTGDFALSLIFGAIAPASAPAGTVAVIQEYRARGRLTKALYAVVGFDDGLGIIIFGFAAAIARRLIESDLGRSGGSFISLLAGPFTEVFLSIVVGGIIAVALCLLVRRLEDSRDVFIVLFGTVLLVIGLSNLHGLSLILTNMIVGLVIVNTQPHALTEKISGKLTDVMPLLFVLFFALAGANLHLATLPSLGVLGIVYILCRSAGLIGGARAGAAAGNMDTNIRKYLGLGILSQAGVAIGLAMSVKHEFTPLGEHGAELGATVITTITATCIFFELIGPMLTKYALSKAGEIPASRKE